MELGDYFKAFMAQRQKLFGNQEHWPTFEREMGTSLEFLRDLEVEIVGGAEGGILLSRAPEQTTANFGYLIFPESEKSFQDLWLQACEKGRAMGIEKLKGPIQANTFFPYRFISTSNERPFFQGEFFSEPKEHEWMMALEPDKEIFFRSAYRDHFDGIMEVSKPFLDKLLPKGLSFQKHEEVDDDLLVKVFEIVGKSLGGNWSFGTLGVDHLRGIFLHETQNLSKLALMSIWMKDEMVGFIRFFDSEEGVSVCKTMAILPEYQRMGIGNAAVYEMHRVAGELGYREMIYALIAWSNRVQEMPQHDAITFRTYSAYEFELT